MERLLLRVRSLDAPGAVVTESELREELLRDARERSDDRRWRQMALAVARIALDMSGIRERNQLLQDIVVQAQQLLRVDLCYISLNDWTAQRTYVHSTTGVVTEAYRTISMPLGAGVLGSAAGAKASVQTRDYMSDDSLVHVPEIDAIVQGERVRAILGSPMRVDGEIIGALMVADRSVREYDYVEVSTLEVLASLAAVALETTRLLGELRGSITELESVQVQNQRHIDDLQHLADVDARLLGDLANGADAEALQSIVANELGCRAAVQLGPALSPWGELQSEAEELDRLRRESERTGAFATNRARLLTVFDIAIAGRSVGAIAVELVPGPVALQILQRIALAASARVLFDDAVAHAAGRERSELLRAVVAGRSSAEEGQRLARISPLDFAAAASCAVFAVVCHDKQEMAVRLTAQLRQSCAVLVHDDHVCVISTDARIVQHPQERLRAALSGMTGAYSAGVAVRAPGAVAEAHDEARMVSRSLQRLERFGEVGTATSIGSIGLLLADSRASATKLVADTIGPLLAYDEKHQTQLARTALRYLDSDRQISAVASQLCVHENTVRQRLAKVREVLGEQSLSATRALDTHLALRTWALTSSS
ncbi:MAG: GAF domain-containing protein [Deltaproteobacteria bacterium]